MGITRLSLAFLIGFCFNPAWAERTVILGFDGMDPRLTQQWMQSGQLPHFKKLADSGHFQSLGTTNPPQSPVAWSSFATGLFPGDHGVFDFLRRNPETYSPEFSISELKAASRSFSVLDYEIPLDGAEFLNRRKGEPFWLTAERMGHKATVLRVPVTFPPDPVSHMISGMGVPDLLGTQGTYTLFTNNRMIANAENGGQVVRVRPNRHGQIDTHLTGPGHPLKSTVDALKLPLSISPSANQEGMTIQLDKHNIELKQGDWSEWLPISFNYLGPISIHGMVRMKLLSGYPELNLYVSPIHPDPMNDSLGISSPQSYASTLAEKIGRYHTLGMPEETWSLNQNHVDDDTFLDMIETTLKEREAMFYDALQSHDSELVIGVFVQTDRVSHMFWRAFDTGHPLYSATSERARQAIPWIYGEADRILGKTLDQLKPDDRLIVLSDHGFRSFRYGVNLNRWLIDKGFMKLKGNAKESGPLFEQVDWSKTQAYALGLNGLFINLKGRESQGIVTDDEVKSIKQKIQSEMIALKHDLFPNDIVISNVFDGQKTYMGRNNKDAPDLVIGYAPNYRASWQTTLGAAPIKTIEPNTQNWSGDHCMDPKWVPGILFTNFEPESGIQHIGEIRKYMLKRWIKGQ